MEQENFDRSVPIFVGMGYRTDVRSVSHAHALLSDWPVDQRDTAHAMALRACKAAMVGALDTETARRLFETFARRKDILAPDPSPLVAGIAAGTLELPASR
jgi:hypothetical protein